MKVVDKKVGKVASEATSEMSPLPKFEVMGHEVRASRSRDVLTLDGRIRNAL